MPLPKNLLLLSILLPTLQLQSANRIHNQCQPLHILFKDPNFLSTYYSPSKKQEIYNLLPTSPVEYVREESDKFIRDAMSRRKALSSSKSSTSSSGSSTLQSKTKTADNDLKNLNFQLPSSSDLYEDYEFKSAEIDIDLTEVKLQKAKSLNSLKWGSLNSLDPDEFREPLSICKPRTTPNSNSSCCTPEVERIFLKQSEEVIKKEFLARVRPIQMRLSEIRAKQNKTLGEEFRKSLENNISFLNGIFAKSSNGLTMMKSLTLVTKLPKQFNSSSTPPNLDELIYRYNQVNMAKKNLKSQKSGNNGNKSKNKNTSQKAKSNKYVFGEPENENEIDLDLFKSASLSLAASRKKYVDPIATDVRQILTSIFEFTLDEYIKFSVDMDIHSKNHPQYKCFSEKIKIEKEAHSKKLIKKVENLAKNIKLSMHEFYKLAMYVDILEELIETSIELDLSKSCLEAFTKMVYCKTCGDLDSNYKRSEDSKRIYTAKHRSCKNFCFNVMRGCLAPTYHLQSTWQKYHTLLISYRKDGHNYIGKHYNELLTKGLNKLQNMFKSEQKEANKIGVKLVEIIEQDCKIAIKPKQPTLPPLSKKKSGNNNERQKHKGSRKNREKPFHHEKSQKNEKSDESNESSPKHTRNARAFSTFNERTYAHSKTKTVDVSLIKNPNIRLIPPTNAGLKNNKNKKPTYDTYEIYDKNDPLQNGKGFYPDESEYDDYDDDYDYKSYDYSEGQGINDDYRDGEYYDSNGQPMLYDEGNFYDEDDYSQNYNSFPDEDYYTDEDIGGSNHNRMDNPNHGFINGGHETYIDGDVYEQNVELPSSILDLLTKLDELQIEGNLFGTGQDGAAPIPDGFCIGHDLIDPEPFSPSKNILECWNGEKVIYKSEYTAFWPAATPESQWGNPEVKVSKKTPEKVETFLKHVRWRQREERSQRQYPGLKCTDFNQNLNFPSSGPNSGFGRGPTSKTNQISEDIRCKFGIFDEISYDDDEFYDVLDGDGLDSLSSESSIFGGEYDFDMEGSGEYGSGYGNFGLDGTDDERNNLIYDYENDCNQNDDEDVRCRNRSGNGNGNGDRNGNNGNNDQTKPNFNINNQKRVQNENNNQIQSGTNTAENNKFTSANSQSNGQQVDLESSKTASATILSSNTMCLFIILFFREFV